MTRPLLPPASAVEVIELVPSVSVCLSVRLSFSTLTAEPFDVGTLKLVGQLTYTKSRPSLMVKVIGQGHEFKNMISTSFSDLSGSKWSSGLWADMMTSHDVMVPQDDVTWRHMTTWCHFVSNSDLFTVFGLSVWVYGWSMYLCPSFMAKGLRATERGRLSQCHRHFHIVDDSDMGEVPL